jgi:hypothetical protein
VLPLLLRVEAPQIGVLASPNRCSRGSISDPFLILIFSPIISRVLRLSALITAGVSFHVRQSIQIVLQAIQIGWRRMGLISFRVPMRCLWVIGLQSPNPLSGLVVHAVCPTFTLGPTVIRAQGVLPVFGWDM